MKATTFAVAAVGLLGFVAADDNEWEQWSSSEPEAAATPAPEYGNYGDYSYPDPDSKTPDAVTTTTWNDWTTSSKPVDDEKTSTTWSEWTTTSKPVDDDKKTTTTWQEWTTSTTKPVDATTTKPAGNDWEQWSSTPVEATQGPEETQTTLLTSTIYSTITVYPNKDETVTVTQSNVVTKTGAPQCNADVVTSYGAPTWTPTPAGAESSSWSAWSAPASPSASAPATSTWSQWSPPKSSGGLSSNGNKFGMTYSPYTSQGGCKDAETVKADIAKIAGLGFASVRVYSTDCDTLPNVGGAAKEHGLKIILGVFISETGIGGAKPQVDEIVAWAQWDIVELIVIGNEAVFQGFCSASELAGFISSSKEAFKGAGYNGACTTTDELSVWQEHGQEWCGVIDVVAANLYAFFNPEVTADKAGDFIQRQIDDLNKICPDKDSYVMESGWPSAANGCNGAACASPENQATAIKGIQETSGSKVVFFSFEDESWKPDGQWGAEKHFGCASVFE